MSEHESNEPIRIDMSTKDSESFGAALFEAMFSGRPLVMHDSTRPDIPEVGFGMEIESVGTEEGQ
ncbi:hypothetical protein [Streptomyces sp. NRRL F-5630]|uniref:hypothetical protein n=1 Tax=Streptomyces sp. NRRL F-5630 TaxID=1463864 RepID=UPI003D7026D2